MCGDDIYNFFCSTPSFRRDATSRHSWELGTLLLLYIQSFNSLTNSLKDGTVKAKRGIE